MPAKVVKVVITGYYTLPDTLYDKATPAEAVQVDIQNHDNAEWSEAEIIDICEHVEVSWSLVDEVPSRES